MRDRRFELHTPFAMFDPDRLWAADRVTFGIANADFVGTRRDDVLVGTDRADTFDLSRGGDDTASGGKGADTFYFGAAFTGADRVDGGDKARRSIDVVILDGDYSHGVDLTYESLVNVEKLVLTGGSYVLAGRLDFQSRFHADVVDASSLTVDQPLNFDVFGGELQLTSGAAADTIKFGGGFGDAFIDGGAGDDVIISAVGSLYGGSGDDVIDGTTGDVDLFGGDGDDIITGGTWIYSGELNGGAGADRITIGSVSNRVTYYASSESTAQSFDRIKNFTVDGTFGQNRIILDFDSDTTTTGSQRNFHFGPTDGHTGDVVVHYDAGLKHTIVEAFTDGDAIADFTVHLIGDVPLTAANFGL